jgi:hypothetical protein
MQTQFTWFKDSKALSGSYLFLPYIIYILKGLERVKQVQVSEDYCHLGCDDV